MNMSNNPSSKETNNVSEGSAKIETNFSYIGEAEKIANEVKASLEKDEDSSKDGQISTSTQIDNEKETYVFEHPGMISRYTAMTIIITTSLVFIYCLFIGGFTAYFSTTTKFDSIAMILIGSSIVVLLVNLFLIPKLAFDIRFKKRFDIYEELLRYKSLEFVEEIAISAKQKESLVVRDLKLAIKRQLIPQGHFSTANRVFMVSNDVYNRYMKKSAVYDRYFQNILEERHRVKSRTKEISQIMETGEEYIQKFEGYSLLVKDKNVVKQITKMKNVVSMIFREIDAKPNQAQSLSVFLNYYLPTTDKLLNAYVLLDEKEISRKNANQTRKEIEEAINTIVTAFENILEKLYEESEMDIASDIDALELSMKQDGISFE